MNKLIILAAILGICVCGAANAEQALQLANATRELGRSLVATGATLDGAPITALRQTKRCEAIITTARGSTLVHWKSLGDLIASRRDGRTIYDVPESGRHHVLSVRTGKATTDVGTGLSLLDEECGGV